MSQPSNNVASGVTLDGAIVRRAVICGVLGYVALELLSMIGYFWPPAGAPIFLVVVLAVAALAWWRPDFGVLIALAELFTGSQGGALLAYDAGGTIVSLRIGIFLAVFGTWVARTAIGLLRGGVARKEAWAWWGDMRSRGLLWPYIALCAAILYAAARGVMRGNPFSDVFFDANAYAYFALLPAFFAGARASKVPASSGTLLSSALGALMAGIAVSFVKALTVLYFFSHRLFDIGWQFYLWVRDTRTGEITIQTADFYRIFFQSQIWALAFILAGALYAAYAGWKRGRWAVAVVAFAMGSMVLSLSRSFWFGGAVAGLAYGALLLWWKAPAKVWWRSVAIAAGTAVAAVAVIALVYVFPFPRKTGELSFFNLLGSRATSLEDDAANSRWELLPKLTAEAMKHPLLGSGFGTAVTYQTHDPRLLADNPGGQYRTTAFEWGYSDLWLKFGVLGILAYGWFMFALVRPLCAVVRRARGAMPSSSAGEISQENVRALVAAGALLALAALLATHLFSPYLNHPLGIGMLMMVAVLL